MGEQTKEEMISQMRFAINTQMRYKLYRDTIFPYMQSMGMNHIFQGFKDDDNKIFIGVYHLYWTREEDKGITVLNPSKPVAKGTWMHEWLTTEEAEAKQKEIQDNSLVDYEKMTQAIQGAMLEIQQRIKGILEVENDEEDINPVLN
mgnify:FL=1